MVLASFKTPIDGYCARVSECYSLGPVDVFQCVKDVRQAAHCFTIPIFTGASQIRRRFTGG